MQHCQKGRELLLDLQRADWLPPYDDDGVRVVINEIDELWKKLYAIIAPNGPDGVPSVDDILDSVKVSLAYYHQCFSRNTRYIFAYFIHRLTRLRQLRWEAGVVVPDNIRPILSARENDYFMEYSGILNEYCQSIGGIDLMSDYEPPKDLYIEIRVLMDCGEIMTDLGPVTLDAGTSHYLKRTDVEGLIRQGLVEHIQTDQS